jgi:hypothetical protein
MKIETLLERHKALVAEKQPWLTHYQLIGEYIYSRKEDFQGAPAPGGFEIRNKFTNAGIEAAQTASSMFLSLLWPDSARSFILKPSSILRDSTEAQEFFAGATATMAEFMDDEENGLSMALNEYMLDQLCFGTSGLFVKDEDDFDIPVSYKAYGPKELTISEDHKGFVNEVYIDQERTAKELVERYGIDNVAEPVRKAFNGGKESEKFKILFAILPRRERPEGPPKLRMPFAAYHIDLATKYIMEEGGYESMPLLVGRFAKASGEIYGRCPGMTALPAVVELNVVEETFTHATELAVRPPLAVLDDGRLGGGIIDTSPDAINVFNISGLGGSTQPIFPILPQVDLKPVMETRKELQEQIARAFFLDRLLDLNNQTQMTAYEAGVRNKIRGESLSAPFSRQEGEVFKPLCERTFDTYWRKGFFGIDPEDPEHRILVDKLARAGITLKQIPEIVLRCAKAGLPVYEVMFVSPAKRFRQSEKLQGLITATDYANAVAPMNPSTPVVDNIDIDATFRTLVELSGAPVVLRSGEEVKKIRGQRNAAQKQAQDLEGVKIASEAGKNMAAAQQMQKGGSI